MLVAARRSRLLGSAAARALSSSAAGAGGGGDPQQAWEAKAKKECKGGDPYKAFGSTNIDVSEAAAWGGGGVPM